MTRIIVGITTVAAVLAFPVAAADSPRTVAADLLVVGGTEAGVAATVIAARLGVKKIVMVNDIEWLGGQFSAEAVGAIDEWTEYKGKRTEFPRSGLFLEVMQRIREHNEKTYGLAQPGNGFCASDIVEAAAGARIFADLVRPYETDGTAQVQVLRPFQPLTVHLEGKRVAGVTFERVDDPTDKLRVNARLTIDASDWGDVIRLSGSKYLAGPDPRERFQEEHAPKGSLGEHANEMNPLSYCVVLREAAKDVTIPKPAGYDERRYFGTTAVTAKEFAALGWPKQAQAMRVPAFVDTTHPKGIYSPPVNVYTHRRLVDRRHNRLVAGSEKTLLNWPTQDYPLYDFPKAVADALEATEVGASKKNIAQLTPAQRRMVFDDAKRHTLGMVYHLQTTVHDKLGDFPESFRYMELSDEFGTRDRLPPKPYVREGLRLEALYMLREQDIRRRGHEVGWARVMVPDNVFGFQFNLDFHPTRRVFLDGDRGGPWANVHTAERNWSLHTDRAGFPFRGLVPIERDGLLGASKNIGVSSIVSSAVRLHGQMMHTGQVAGTAAFLCLRDSLEPRDLAGSGKRVRELQLHLVRPGGATPGVLLWPYHDVTPSATAFVAANALAVRGILTGDPDSLDFQPARTVTRRELARTLVRARRSLEGTPAFHRTEKPRFTDVGTDDPDRVAIETLYAWGVQPDADRFRPEETADWNTLHAWMKALAMKPKEDLGRRTEQKVTRAEFAGAVWSAIQNQPEYFPKSDDYLKPDQDADGDGIPDLDDPLPFDRNNDGVPDRLDSTAAEARKP